MAGSKEICNESKQFKWAGDLHETEEEMRERHEKNMENLYLGDGEFEDGGKAQMK
jgi:hypothetical protein